MAVIARSSRRSTTPRASLALLCAVLALGTAACASSSTSSSGTAAATSGPKPTPTLITSDEIARVSVQNAYEVVQKLRPSMLRQRQVASANGQGGMAADAPAKTGTTVNSGALVVYVDGTRLGDVDQLRGIPATSIASLRYYSASEAQTKWGSGHPGGAIEVLSKR